MNTLDFLFISPNPQQELRLMYMLSGIQQPLGLGYIASYLRSHNYNVGLLDNAIFKFTPSMFKDYLLKTKPRYIGFSMFTGCSVDVYNLASVAKKIDKNIKIIAGGPHATALPAEVLKNDSIDIVVKGEGEITTLELIRHLDNNISLFDLAGIAFKENNVAINNPDRPLLGNLDDLPMPAYELMPMGDYYPAIARRFSNGRIGAIVTSRGCPHRCTFCSKSIFGQTIRYKSPESVVDEIRHLVKFHKIKELTIQDEAFTSNKNHILKICELINKNKISIPWTCWGRASEITDEICKALKSGGCKVVCIGAESGSQNILNLFKKDTTIGQIESAIYSCKKNGILTQTSFIIGSPWETKETLRKTLNFAKKISPDTVSFCALTPLPGSEIFNEFIYDKKIDPAKIDWEKYHRIILSEQPVQIGQFTNMELKRWQKRAIFEYYFRFNYFLQRIQKIKNFNDVIQLFSGLIAILTYQITDIILKISGILQKLRP